MLQRHGEGTRSSGWHGHHGAPASREDWFPIDPPPRIGAVVSATTFLRRDGLKPAFPAAGQRTAVLVAVAGLSALLLLGVLGSALVHAVTGSGALALLVVGSAGVIIGLALRGLVWRFIDAQVPLCSFVGTEGIARVTGQSQPSLTVLRYCDIGEAQVVESRLHDRGVHVATRYEFYFASPSGSVLMAFSATRAKGLAVHGDVDELPFGMAAVAAWRAARS